MPPRPEPPAEPAGRPPTLVGALRGLAIGAAVFVVGGLVSIAVDVDPSTLGRYAPLVPLGLVVLRSAEGWLDQRAGQPDQDALVGGHDITR